MYISSNGMGMSIDFNLHKSKQTWDDIHFIELYMYLDMPLQNCYIASMPMVLVPSTASNWNGNMYVLSEHDKCWHNYHTSKITMLHKNDIMLSWKQWHIKMPPCCHGNTYTSVSHGMIQAFHIANQAWQWNWLTVNSGRVQQFHKNIMQCIQSLMIQHEHTMLAYVYICTYAHKMLSLVPQHSWSCMIALYVHTQIWMQQIATCLRKILSMKIYNYLYSYPYNSCWPHLKLNIIRWALITEWAKYVVSRWEEGQEWESGWGKR